MTLDEMPGGDQQQLPGSYQPTAIDPLSLVRCLWVIIHNIGIGDQLWPAVSTRYSTASPLNGGVNDCEDEPAIMGL